MPILEEFEAAPVRLFCGVKQDRLPDLPESLLNSFYHELRECDNNSAIYKHFHREKVNEQIILGEQIDNNNITCLDKTETNNNISAIMNQSLQSSLIKRINKIKYPIKDCCDKIFNEKIVCDNVFLKERETFKCKSEWINERQFKVTGSRCYDIYTYSLDDWITKSSKYFWPTSNPSGKAVTDGVKNEKPTRNKYSEITGAYIEETGLIICQTEPWLAYSTDGVVMKDSKVDRLLEIKCPFEIENLEEKTILKKCNRYIKKDKKTGVIYLNKKHKYFAQIQLGMALLNINKCDFVLYSDLSQEVKIWTIPIDNDYAFKLLKTLKKNYFEKMLHNICTLE